MQIPGPNTWRLIHYVWEEAQKSVFWKGSRVMLQQSDLRPAALTWASHKGAQLVLWEAGQCPSHLFLMFSGFRTMKGTAEDFRPPLRGVSVLSSLISVVFKAGTRVLRILWQSGDTFLSSLAHELWISPVFCGAFRAGDEVWSPSGWDLLVGEMISEKATFRLLLPGESNKAPEFCWEILVLGVLGKPNHKRNHHDNVWIL